MAGRDVIVIGTSTGGVVALTELARALPPGLPAALFVVCHFPAEGFSRLTWEIEGPGQDGVCRLTVTHELAGMPSLFAMTSGDNEFGEMGGGGWPWILSDLKTLLETGAAFPKA